MTLDAILAALDAAEKLYSFVTTAKGTLAPADKATVEARLADAEAARKAEQALVDAELATASGL